MRKAKAIVIASIAATIVPAIAVTLYFMFFALIAAFTDSTNGTESKMLTIIFLAALPISAAHVIFLGLPAVWLLNKLNRLKFRSVVIVGFVAGCIPMSVWSWPVEYSKYKSSYSYWNGKEMVQAKIDGVPTLIGWVDYLQSVTFMGVLGAIASLSFWWVWKYTSPDNALQPPAKSGG